MNCTKTTNHPSITCTFPKHPVITPLHTLHYPKIISHPSITYITVPKQTVIHTSHALSQNTQSSIHNMHCPKTTSHPSITWTVPKQPVIHHSHSLSQNKQSYPSITCTVPKQPVIHPSHALSQNNQSSNHNMHCPKTKLNVCIKTKLVKAGVDEPEYIWLTFP